MPLHSVGVVQILQKHKDWAILRIHPWEWVSFTEMHIPTILGCEAIASGKYRTIKEIANIAGYSSRTHFSKLFKEVYGVEVSELL